MKQNQEKKSIRALIDSLQGRNRPVVCSGLAGAEISYMIHRLYHSLKIPMCIIAADMKTSEQVYDDIQLFQADLPMLRFPPYNILPFKLAYHNETAANRVQALYRLTSSDETPVVFTSIDAIRQKVIPRKELSNYAELIQIHEEIQRDSLVEKLIASGYTRTIIVEEPGDFSVRGGIMDIFSPMYPEPIRVEFFGDDVDSIRFFSAATQRKLKSIDEAIIIPAREAIFSADQKSEIIQRMKIRAAEQGISVSHVRDMVEQIHSQGLQSGMESLIPLIYPEPDSFFNYLPASTLLFLIHPSGIESAIIDLDERSRINFSNACNESRLCVAPEELYLSRHEIETAIFQKNPVLIHPLLTYEPSDDSERERFDFTVQDNSRLIMELKAQKEHDALLLPVVNWIKENREHHLKTILVCATRTQIDRIATLLKPYGLLPHITDTYPWGDKSPDTFLILLGKLSSGFVWEDESLAILTEDEVFGKKFHRKKRLTPHVHTELISFADLSQGDWVVHTEHGIGKFEGLTRLKIDGVANDFLIILYRDNDKLYLPVDRLNMIQKYMGVEDHKPVLDKMGGKTWDRVKSKVKKSVEKIAGELLKLYAERKRVKGHSFRMPDGFYRDFEAGFPYEETPDQLNTIEEVLDDMRQEMPMDRLVCGDVGYGKTEVALRASFVAVNDGKQVAMLVPTTVLAEQHHATFVSRFEKFPVTIACLNRFRSQQEQRAILKGLKDGKIDVVIGTHRIIQKDVEIKDLGLLIVDEEQRFGVKHKESLKRMRSNVDVLALTATPIPRTLHMSMMGIRDISTIATPPEERRPIITYICELDDGIIKEAISRELKRKGQIYFVHNDVRSLRKMADHIQSLAPEIRLDIAHGQMENSQLEDVVMRFIRKELDMLVCTTIIESGLDIPSANTMLINRADRFGLAQMYQLRGRVGRSSEQAYAYLFIPQESTLTKDAQKRLKVLMEHSDLGSGFQIALNDLKIRGGGTILGASQSGHIAAVGYDMFLQLMENAVSEQKGETVVELLVPEINIAISALFPETYIPDIHQRLSAYRRLSKMTEVQEIADFKNEIMDRFGALPTEATNLLFKIMLKILAKKAGIKKMDMKNNLVFISFSETHLQNPATLVDMIRNNPKLFELTPDNILKIKLAEGSQPKMLAQTKNILKEIVNRVS